MVAPKVQDPMTAVPDQPTGGGKALVHLERNPNIVPTASAPPDLFS